MNFPRIATLASALLLAGTAHAADVSMADGQVHFSTPSSWLDIMDTQGDPEVHVFQVPDPSPTGQNSLARVTVTVKQVPSISGFHQYIGAASARARALQGYAAATAAEPNSSRYTAQENGAQLSYSERYWFKGSYAIQLRCARPTQSEAGAAWAATFDQGCDAIAAQLK